MATKRAENEYNSIREECTGLAQLFDILIEQGMGRERLISNASTIKEAISYLPMIDGVIETEFKSLFEAKFKEMNEIGNRYKEKLADIPSRENKIRNDEFNLQMREARVRKEEMRLQEIKDSIAREKDKIEKAKKEIYSFETPEARDTARKANMFLDYAPSNQWTQKAIAWGLGSILSGTPIPDFRKKPADRKDREPSYDEFFRDDLPDGFGF